MTESNRELTDDEIEFLKNSSPRRLRLIAKHAKKMAKESSEEKKDRPEDVPDDATISYDKEEYVVYWQWEEDGTIQKQYKEPMTVWHDSYPPR